RLRVDRAVPRWARVLTPLIGAAQLLAVILATQRRRHPTARHPQDPLPEPYVARTRVSGVELKLLIATEEGRQWYDPETTRSSGRWDALELDYARSLGLFEEGAVVYDVGANHGVLSLFFAAQVGPT